MSSTAATEAYQCEAKEVLQSLSVGEGGLVATEVESRRQQYGLNQLETKTEINPFKVFVDQFKSFIIYILLFAVFFSLLIGEYVDSIIILVILLTNAIIGFFQELSAHKSLEALKKISTVKAMVLRDGVRKTLEAKLLVPGDIILLEAGDKVPADARIIEAVRLKVEESALTGESVPVEKNADLVQAPASIGDRHNMLFSSTALATGHCRAVVVATGMQTELGKITTLIKEAKEEMTPLQKRLDQFGKKLGAAIIAICFVVFMLFFFKAYYAGAVSMQVFVALAFIAISLAVAAVPTALPAVVTIALSIGVKRLLNKQALVRKLSSVETLGSCDVICTDKTGTLTENRMTVRYAWTADGEASLDGVGYAFDGEVAGPVTAELFRCGLLCNNASIYQEEGSWRVAGDPTEAALLTSAARAGVSSTAVRRAEVPFDSERKMMSVLVEEHDKEFIYTKGALGAVLECCSGILVANHVVPLTAEYRREIEARNQEYASEAMRVLAFAMRQLSPGEGLQEDALVFVGLQAMIDPPRPDVIESIAKTKEAGIRVIMITGDYGETAKAIGREIGIVGKSIDGGELEQMGEAELMLALQNGVNIFSRVDPEHKQMIVQALQKMGNIVAMTGDGVNDAPALKKANIGVAVGSGTEVAKDAADFVLLDDSFTHIVNAIEEGRGIYDNIQKSIMLLLSGNLGEVLIIFLAAIFGMNLPLTAILLLWINMVTDGAPALAYSVDPYSPEIMLRQPKPHNEGILPGPKLALLGILGSVGTVIALTLFSLSGGSSVSSAELIHAQTMVFNFVVLYEVILTFIIRNSYRVPLFTNPWVWSAAILSVILQGLLMYTDLSKVFKIVPLALTDLGILFTGGGLFVLASILYEAIAGRNGFAVSSKKKQKTLAIELLAVIKGHKYVI
jgi:Ca2+-transporting ATPase